MSFGLKKLRDQCYKMQAFQKSLQVFNAPDFLSKKIKILVKNRKFCQNFHQKSECFQYVVVPGVVLLKTSLSKIFVSKLI